MFKNIITSIKENGIRSTFKSIFFKLTGIKLKKELRESKLAHQYLDGLCGIEIGGSAHNPFGLNTRNVDNTDRMDTVYKLEEIQICGKALKVDIVAPGDVLPLPDKSVDFVISSHVIEHFFDPIKALKEWQRVATKYIFIIFPNKERTFDKHRPLTPVEELIDRHEGRKVNNGETDDHHSVWVLENFMQLMHYMKFNVVAIEDPDKKVGNGTAIVIKLD